MTAVLRARKQEREQLIAVLDEQHATIDDAADAVWRIVAAHVLARDWFVAVSVDSELWVNGPWGSREQAGKALATLPLPGDGRVFIRRLLTTAAGFEQPMLGDDE